MKKIVIVIVITFICIIACATAHAETPTVTPTQSPTSTPTPLPMPYMFYMEVPLIIDAQMPQLNVKGFTSGYNDDEKKYIYIVLVEQSSDDAIFQQWVYAIVRDSPLPVVMVEVGDNTVSAYYDFVRELLP